MTTKSPNSRIGTPVDRAPKAPTNARSGPASQRARSWAATAAIIAIVLAVVTAALLVTHTPAQAQSAVLISNTGQTADSSGTVLTNTTAKLAQGFTLLASASTAGYTVDSIGIAFHTIGDTSTVDDDLTVTLNANSSSGSPGNVLCTLSNPSTFSASGVHTFDAPTTGTACPLLTQNKTYFAVIERANNNTDTISLNTTASTDEDSGGATGWSISNIRKWYTTAWGTTSGESHQIEIKGHEGPPNNSAAGVPTISGTLRVQETLTADTSGIADDDGLTNMNFSFKWVRIDGEAETEIPNATNSTYTLTDDAYKQVKVKVSFTDDLGNPEGPLSSELTNPILPANTLVSNTEQAAQTTGNALNSSFPKHAQAFTTGASNGGYTQSSIDYRFGEISDTSTAGTDLQMTLNEVDSDNKPGDALCTLTDPATFASSTVNTFAAPETCPTLTKETSYFLVIERVDTSGANTVRSSRTFSNSEDAGSVTAWSIDNTAYIYTGSNWDKTLLAGMAHQIGIRGVPGNPATGVPTISGPNLAQLELTADTSGIEDADGLDDVLYGYQWVRVDGTTETDITGATNSTYTLTNDDVGKTIKVEVSFTDDLGNPEGPLSSELTNPILPANTLVSNTEQAAQTTGNALNSSFPKHAQAFTTGASNGGYTQSSIDYRFGEISDTSTAGTDLQMTLNEVDSDNKPGDALCTLTDPATFASSTVNTFAAPETCPTLTKETSYFLVIERVDTSGANTVRSSRTFSNSEDAGSVTAWSIDNTAYIYTGSNWDKTLLAGMAHQIGIRGSDTNNDATGAPTITGTPRVGEVLTADTSAIEDDDGLSNVSYVYQWLHVDGMDEADISDATKSTYRLTIDDVDKNIKVKVTFDDDLGNAEGPLFSVPTEAISEGITLSATSDLIPTDLASDKFRLIFITYQGHPATSTDIENYNAYVQSQANAGDALAGIKAHSSSFRVLGSTADVDARDNTYTTYTDDEPGVPIYWLNGNKVADDYADLYDGSWDDEANPTLRNGNTTSPTVIWTGSSTNGTELIATGNVSRALGKSFVQTGRLNHDPGGPLETNLASNPAIEDFRYYALSPVFVVPPRVNSVALTSDPNDDSRTGDDDTYAIDDTLEATVSFNVAADITGSPELTLLFGTAEKTASCAADTNTTTMVCSYTVVLNDTAPLGVGFKANSLTLNGGTITTTGDTTSVSLAHDAVGLQSEHKVDAIRPTLVTTGSNAPKTSTNGLKIILTFSESVSSLDRSKITIMIPSTTTTLATNGGRVNGSTVELDLTTAVLVTSAAITVELAADAVEDTAGNGNLALAATSITNNVAAVADAPTALTAVPAPDTKPQVAIDLTWTASASDGGSAITKHQYRYKTGSNAFGNWTNIPNSAATEANATSYTVKGLTANNPPTTFTFEVQAVNANGDSGESNQASATVDVPARPDPPTATAGDQQITVSWVTPANNGSAILRYQYFIFDDTNENVFTPWTNIPGSSATTTSYTATGLTNGNTYGISIRAVNHIGVSFDSLADSKTPGTFPTAPRNLTAEPGDTQVRLEWTAPASNGGNTIDGYEYQQKAGTNAYGSWTDISGANANTTEHTVTGLTNGTIYRFKVRAKNPMGEGPASNEASATPITVPSVPQNFTLTPGNGRVRLDWTAPTSDGGSAILRYEYRHKAGTDSFTTWTNVPGSNINTTQYTVTGLINGTLYTFEIRAATATTDGMAASETTTPMAVAPDAPRELSTRSQNQAIELTWRPPLDNGGSPITKYEYRQRTGNGPFGTWMNIPNSGVTGLNATSYTVTGLTNGTSYHFKLRAVNNADESAASNEALGIPQAITTPDKPRGGQLSSGDGKVIVQWIEPLRDGGTPILHYEYCLRQKSQCNGHWVEIPDSAPGGDNHGLYEITRSNGTFTRVYLRAVNDQGAGHSFDYSAVPLAGAPAAPTNLRAEAPSSEYVKISWNEPRARSGVTIIGYSLENSRDGVTWARNPYCLFPYCDQQYLGHGRHPRGTNSIMTRIGEDATLYYRIRTFFYTNTPTIVNDIDFSRGASPSSPIITVTTVGATGILPLPTIGVTGGHGREGANDVIVFDLWITGHQQRTTPVTVIYRTVDLRARAGSDYSTRSGLLTFAPTDTEKTVSVPIIDDAVEDSGEEFILRLSNASGALIARAGAFGTITNTEESLTGFTLVNAATETDVGSIDHDSTVELTDPTNGQYGIRVDTVPDTGIESVRLQLFGAKTVTRTDNEAPYTLYAQGGEALPAGTYTLQATAYPKADRVGNALESISISFTVTEAPEETAALSASFPGSRFTSNAHSGSDDRPQVIVTFSEAVDSFDKTTPSVSVTNGAISSFQAHTEAGLDNAYVFFLTPNGNEDVAITFFPDQACASGGICTADGTTLSQVPTALTIPGPVEATTTSPITASFANMPADHDGTSSFTFQLNFSENVNAGYAKIRDHTFTVTGGHVNNASRITQGSNQGFYVTVEPDDNGPVSITLPATTDCTANRAICTDDDRKLSHPTSATVAGPPAISVSDASVQEAQGALLNFTVTLSRISTRTVTVAYATSDGSATAGSDYTAASGTLTFNAGDTSKTIQVAVITDSDDEGQETLTLTLSNPVSATLADATGSGTIENGDSPSVTEEDPPTEDPVPLTASFANVPADHNGSNFTFQLNFSENVEAGYARIRDHAFTVTGATIDSASRITQGSNQGWNVEVNPTGNEAITITLPETTNCSDDEAICTDDERMLSHSTEERVEGPPAISVSDATMQEAEGATLEFSVTLSHASSRTVTVSYATQDGTATAGLDYTATSATLTFNAGDLSQTVEVTVLTDSEDEGQETLTLTLSNPSQATLDDATGTGTIENGESSSGTQEDPPAEDPPVVLLTASFGNMPATHNGSAFTFDLTFSENVKAGYERIRDDAFNVTGGDITQAQRKVQGSNQTWTITVEPDGNGAVTITLPETTDCTATGAICTSDGRILSNSTTVTLSGSG